MKCLNTIALLTLVFHIASAQQVLSLEECYRLAESNYPRIQQKQLFELTRQYSVENAARAALPRLSLGGQATYQSDVTQIPVEMPGVEPLSKDQYRIFAEVSQTLYHGGLVSEQKELEDRNADVEQVQLAVDLYSIRGRVNELYFGLLLLDEQRALAELSKKDLSAALTMLEAMIDNGTAIPSSGAVLQAELLKVDQRIVELAYTADAYRKMLGIFVSKQITADTNFEKPVFQSLPEVIERPELKLFESQQKIVETNRSLSAARRKPRIEFFVQGGYGRPGLNMLKNEFNFYYLGGLRFSWMLSGYYTVKRENQLLDIRQQSIAIQKETFLFNTAIQLSEHQSNIAKLQRLLEVDRAIIDLRTQVRETARVQLEEGVITSPDFIREVNAEDQAKQDLALHQTQLLLAQAKYHFVSGH